MLSIANKYKLILLLHLKEKNGLHGIDCDDYIHEIYNIMENYPDIKIIIPHMGRAHCPKVASRGLKKIIKYFGTDKLYFDTSACTQKSLLRYFLKIIL